MYSDSMNVFSGWPPEQLAEDVYIDTGRPTRGAINDLAHYSKHVHTVRDARAAYKTPQWMEGVNWPATRGSISANDLRVAKSLHGYAGCQRVARALGAKGTQGRGLCDCAELVLAPCWVMASMRVYYSEIVRHWNHRMGNYFLQSCMIPKGTKGHWHYRVPAFCVRKRILYCAIEGNTCRRISLCRTAFCAVFGLSDDRLQRLAFERKRDISATHVSGRNPFYWVESAADYVYFVTPTETNISWRFEHWLSLKTVALGGRRGVQVRERLEKEKRNEELVRNCYEEWAEHASGIKIFYA